MSEQKLMLMVMILMCLLFLGVLWWIWKRLRAFPAASPSAPPHLDLILTVMKPEGRLFNAEEMQQISLEHVLQLSEEGILQMISPNSGEVTLHIFSIRRPGTFPQHWEEFQGTDGLVLLVSLPTSVYPEESLTLLHAVAYEIAQKHQAQVCDISRKPLDRKGEIDLAMQVKNFSRDYGEWLRTQKHP